MTTTGKIFSFEILTVLWMVMMLGAGPSRAAARSVGQNETVASGGAMAEQPPPDLTGTWSGTFFPKHSNIPAFEITVVIRTDQDGRLVATSSLNSDCLKDLPLQVAIAGLKVVLAGSDEDGNNITIRGSVDSTGMLLKSTYILNGSATGKCETDDGKGTLAKR